jgi:cysteine-rich repeat protein
MLILLIAVLAASGCSELDDPALCPGGLICPAGTICAANQDTCITGLCGNGIIDIRADEVCDDGNIIAGDGCSQDCTSNEECGNSVVDTALEEICDDGNRASGDGCSADCTSSEICGDGFVNELAGEQCDDGGNSAHCDADCTALSCGDGLVNPVAGEQCDPPSPTCSTSCLRINCGDGIKDPGEDCDAGGVNTETCDADCTVPACGDNMHNPVVGEICDDGGNTVTCDADCTPTQCSDGYHNAAAGEECDERGNTITCDADCTMARCGDGYLNSISGESCDAGGQETAACDGDCTAPRCGDGWWNPATGEQCDTAGDSPGCDQDCTEALCGDQVVNPAAGEACDDGNLLNTDQCTAVCEPAACTDGFQNANEIDVDCGGHCGSHSCEMLQHCSTNEDCITGVCLGDTCVPNWSRLATGNVHTCALLDNGAVRCWGRGISGRLGYGNTNNIGDNEVPASGGNVNVGGNVIQISAGDLHTCALLGNGAVRCWGYGAEGRLGYGNINQIGDDEEPAAAGDINVGGTVIQISAGGHHTCALLNTGTVRCWGYGGSGQLGYGNTANIGDSETPASAGNVNIGGTVIQIAAGRYHTCALLNTGSVRCWGIGESGQLGYGNTNNIGDDETPASAGNVNVGGPVTQIAAGGAHTCALLDTGTVRCWGAASEGKLGYGNMNSIGDNETPASAGNVNVGGPVIQIAAGNGHSCALLDTGTVRCWGDGNSGRLGYGNTSHIGDNEEPASVGNVNVGGSVIHLATGGGHTCALLDTGTVRCWGGGADGRLGYGNTANIGDNESPASAGNVNVGGTVIQIAAGNFHTCVLLDTGAVRCWGRGNSGRLGYGNTNTIGDNESPASAGNVNVGGHVIQIVAGGLHTCALLDTGAVRCWGYGADGRLGYGNTNNIGDNEGPATVGNVNVGGTVIQIAAGEDHTCALLDIGAVRCWGWGYYGQLGYGNMNNIGDNETPASAGNVNVGSTVIQITAGDDHTCALLDTGTVRCWGHGADGRLGYGNTSNIGDNEAPTTAGNVNIGGYIIQIAAGDDHTCALLNTGAARCWGLGDTGQLGYGNTNDIGDNEAPATAGNVIVGGTIVKIAAGAFHTCALLNTGAVRCWGYGFGGQLGYGNTNDIGDNETPASAGNVNVGGNVIQLAAGNDHTCSLLDTGMVRCWGVGDNGQLGYGNTNNIGDNETPTTAGNVNIGGSILQSTASLADN